MTAHYHQRLNKTRLTGPSGMYRAHSATSANTSAKNTSATNGFKTSASHQFIEAILA